MMIRMRDPYAGLLAVQSAFDNAMRSDWLGARTSSRGVYPPVNVFRQGEDFVLIAELPGVNKEDINIEVKGDQVRISGVRAQDADLDSEQSVHRRERGVGRFDRTLSIPATIEAAKVSADFDNGLLTVHLPRAESDKARSVAIN